MQEFLNGIDQFVDREDGITADKTLRDIAYSLEQAAIVVITDARGDILYANELFSRMSKYTNEELVGANQRIVNSGYHPRSFFKEMWATIGKGDIWRGEIRNRAKDGTYYWVDTTIVPFMDDKGKPYQYISFRYDITERKLMEQEIRKGAELYEMITHNSSDFIAVIDCEGKFYYASPSFEHILNLPINQLIESPLRTIVSPRDFLELEDKIQTLEGTDGRTPVYAEFTIHANNDKQYVMEATINQIRDSASYENKLLLVMRDITARVESENTIRHLVYNDQLTALLNRTSFRNQLSLTLDHAKTTDQAVALIYINIDRLRYANDLLGHEVGDYLLSVVAERLREMTVNDSGLARIAGDEFAFMITELENEEAVKQRVEEIRLYLEEPIDVGEQTYSLSISCGISMFPEHAKMPSELVSKATQALGRVKARGGGESEMYQHGTSKKTLERILLENELRKSVQQNHFYLDYQRKVNLATGKTTGLEVLVRWNHPDLGIIPPNKFIPLAEETKIIIPIGEWILREVCKRAKDATKTYEGCRFAVNISTVQLEDDHFVQMVLGLIEEYDVPAEMIELELTESAFADVEEMKDKIQQLRNAGITIAIDDFGTGYSTFSYIKKLPADTLKIDMSFVRDILENENSQAIVKAIVTLADTAGLNVIAEGIESEEQSRMLFGLGCREGQGFFYGRPTSLVNAKQCQ